LEDFTRFLTKMNMYPAEKNLKLVFERFDKDLNGIVDFDEFEANVKPVMSGVKDF
jgi:Ca2+-binding EF-hand superfamily protein